MIDSRLRHPLFFVLLLMPGVGPPPALSAQPDVGLKAGSLGAGVEASGPLAERWRLRGWIAAYEQDLSYTASDIDYEGDLELLSVAAVVDWHPGGRSFRLTGGLVWNENTVTGRAPLLALLGAEIDELDGIVLPTELGDFRGELTTDPVGPYLGFGWGRSAAGSASGWGFSADLGVVFHGEPDAELVLDDSVLALLEQQFPEGLPLVEALLEREEREIEDEVDGYRTYPVLSFSLSYRF